MSTIVNAEFKSQCRTALLHVRDMFTGSDAGFAKQWQMNAAVFSRIKKGQVDGVLSDFDWQRIARELGVGMRERKWNTARTEVFETIEEDVLFCKKYSKARVFVDDCEIGKTHTAKYLSRTLVNCFYVDASQSKKKVQFVRALAKAIGVDYLGTYTDVKANIKYYLNYYSAQADNKIENKPIVIIDEAGDLDYTAFLELKEFWNATENTCGWYMIGADGLRAKMERGIHNQKVGYRELFSRFSGNYGSAVPTGSADKILYYEKLLHDVLEANMQDTTNLKKVIDKCLNREGKPRESVKADKIGGLRRAESLLLLMSA